LAKTWVISHEEGQGARAGAGRAQINDLLRPARSRGVRAVNAGIAPIGIRLDVGACGRAAEVSPKHEVMAFAYGGVDALLRGG
jgi:hypothetical protein